MTLHHKMSQKSAVAYAVFFNKKGGKRPFSKFHLFFISNFRLAHLGEYLA
jgi:hypothetical protein